MLGPVFTFEWRMVSRRWQYYAGRSGFVATLLAALVVVWWSEQVNPYPRGIARRQLAEIGERFFYGVLGTQLGVVLLAAPAMAAGAICWDKARGTLAHVLTTDLTNREIVLGKLAARLVPALGLVACALPVLFLGALVGGIDEEALLAGFVVSVGLAVLGAALALTFSVWCSKTYEVLLATYAVWTVVLLAGPVARWVGLPGANFLLYQANPFWLTFAPYLRPGSAELGDAFAFLAGTLALAGGLAGLAAARVRAVALRQGDRPARARRRRVPAGLERGVVGFLGPPLDFNPVLWREWRYHRPSRWVRVVWWLYLLGAAAASVWAVVADLRTFRANTAFVNAFQVSIGLLLLGVGSAAAMVDERVRGTLEPVLTTPLPTSAIVWGKWWAAFRRVPLLVLLPVAVVACLAVRHQSHWEQIWLLGALILAYGAAVTSLGLALATWVARPGRAMSLTAVVYVAVTVGCFIWLLVTQSREGAGFALGSPWFGPGQMTAHVGERMVSVYGTHVVWEIGWTVAYATAAATLLVLMLGTFNRCLGRMPYGTPAAHATRAGRFGAGRGYGGIPTPPPARRNA